MEAALVVVGAVLLYLLARGRGAQKQEIQDLRNFCFAERGKHGLEGHWEGDFVTMTATFDPHDPDSLSDTDSPAPEFALRRLAPGEWEADRVGEHHGELSASVRLPADVAAPLESQYQRFLLHYRQT